MRVFCVGLCGATCSGKTTLSQQLHEDFPHSIVINQDQFYHKEALLPQCSSAIYNWDEPQALNQGELLLQVQAAYHSSHSLCQKCTSSHDVNERLIHLVIIEGTMILALDQLWDYLDASYFLTLDHGTCRQRRLKRTYDGASDPPGYFDLYVWPSYLQLYHSPRVQTSVVLDGCLNLPTLRCLLVTDITAKLKSTKTRPVTEILLS